jgi:hypothetical protein
MVFPDVIATEPPTEPVTVWEWELGLPEKLPLPETEWECEPPPVLPDVLPCVPVRTYTGLGPALTT